MADFFADAISSRRNPRIRSAQQLRDDAGERRREGAYLVEGAKLVREALDLRAPFRIVFVSPRLRADRPGAALLSTLRASGIPLVPVTDGVLGALAEVQTHQGVAAIIQLPARSDRMPAPRRGRPLVVAWHVQDPGNLGAVIRTTEATGAAGLLAAGGGADPYHPRAVRAAAGSLFRVRPVVFPAREKLAERLETAGYRLVASVPRGGTPSTRFDWSQPCALLLGGEGQGLPGPLLKAAAARVQITTEGRVESLSVPAAAAMLLYEAMRQRRTRRPAERARGVSPPSPRRSRSRGGRGGG
jgi:TrmH family RNA methyltransferase